jgi:hypothetical protein
MLEIERIYDKQSPDAQRLISCRVCQKNVKRISMQGHVCSGHKMRIFDYTWDQDNSKLSYIKLFGEEAINDFCRINRSFYYQDISDWDGEQLIKSGEYAGTAWKDYPDEKLFYLQRFAKSVLAQKEMMRREQKVVVEKNKEIDCLEKLEQMFLLQ